jgi:hypothetical protein
MSCRPAARRFACFAAGYSGVDMPRRTDFKRRAGSVSYRMKDSLGS